MSAILLKEIRIDGGTQSRAAINEDVVAEYAEQLKAGAVFPPVVVFNDGAELWLGEGFHRYHAHRKAGEAVIEVEEKTGTRRDAVLYSVGANAAHGLRRSSADKRAAVALMLADDEWRGWSNNAIAKACRVDDMTVARVRREMEAAGSLPKSEVRTYRNRYGNEATMRTENIGARAEAADMAPTAQPQPTPQPTAQPPDVQQQEADRKQGRAEFDPVAELEKVCDENAELQERVAALTAEDGPAAELDRQIRLYNALKTTHDGTLRQAAEMKKALDAYGRFEDQLRKLTGKEKRADILAFVKACRGAS